MTFEDENGSYYKENIKKAESYVEGLQDQFKIEAFKIILSHLLNSNEVTSVASKQNRITKNQDPPKEINVDLPQKIDEFARDCDISPEQLSDIFAIEEDRIGIIYQFKGSEKDNVAMCCQCLVLANEKLRNTEWVSGSQLRESLQDNGIQDKGRHMAEYIADSGLFRYVGKRKSRKYKLTQAGKQKTFEFIKQIVPDAESQS